MGRDLSYAAVFGSACHWARPTWPGTWALRQSFCTHLVIKDWHRSHFGSRYKLDCCGLTSLFRQSSIPTACIRNCCRRHVPGAQQTYQIQGTLALNSASNNVLPKLAFTMPSAKAFFRLEMVIHHCCLPPSPTKKNRGLRRE